MSVLFDFLGGLSRQFEITTPPLYRHPYRNSAEGLRGDMLRLGKDMEFVLAREEESEDD
jgi:hypothetical protein